MHNFNRLNQKNKLVLLAVAVILLIGGIFLFRSSDKLEVNTIIGGAEVNISGNFACLPYKDKSKTEPCVLGLKSDGGTFYALDTSSATAISPEVTPLDKIFINGLIVSLTPANAKELENFDIGGLIRVNNIFTEATEEPEPPFTGPLQNG